MAGSGTAGSAAGCKQQRGACAGRSGTHHDNRLVSQNDGATPGRGGVVAAHGATALSFNIPSDRARHGCPLLFRAYVTVALASTPLNLPPIGERSGCDHHRRDHQAPRPPPPVPSDVRAGGWHGQVAHLPRGRRRGERRRHCPGSQRPMPRLQSTWTGLRLQRVRRRVRAEAARRTGRGLRRSGLG